jgi:hypothetical protein
MLVEDEMGGKTKGGEVGSLIVTDRTKVKVRVRVKVKVN